MWVPSVSLHTKRGVELGVRGEGGGGGGGGGQAQTQKCAQALTWRVRKAVAYPGAGGIKPRVFRI